MIYNLKMLKIERNFALKIHSIVKKYNNFRNSLIELTISIDIYLYKLLQYKSITN